MDTKSEVIMEEEEAPEPEIRYAENPYGKLYNHFRRSYKATWTVSFVPSVNLGLMFTSDFEKNNTLTSPMFGSASSLFNSHWFVQVNPHYYEFDPATDKCNHYISMFICREFQLFMTANQKAICKFQIVNDEGVVINERTTGNRVFKNGERIGWAKFAPFIESKHKDKLIIKIHLETFRTSVLVEPPKIEIIVNHKTISLTKDQVKERVPNLLEISQKLGWRDSDGKFRFTLTGEDDSTIDHALQFFTTGESDLTTYDHDTSFILACQKLILFASKHDLEPLKSYAIKRISENANIQNILPTISTVMELKNKHNIKLTEEGNQILMKCLFDNHNELIELQEFERLNNLDMKDIIQFLFEK